MPLVKCNEHYKCDACTRDMEEGEDVWLDFASKKIYCLICRTKTGKLNYMVPPPKKEEAPVAKKDVTHKTVVIRHESSVKEAELAALKAENKRLKENNKSLREKGKELIAISREVREHNVKLRHMLNI